MSGNANAQHVPFMRALEQEGFEKISYRDGVTVYKHRTAAEIHLAAEARIAASPEQVEAALLDYPGQLGQINRLSESQVLSYGPRWLLVYQRLNLPVISDRDFALKVTWGRNREERWVDYRTVLGGPAPRRGVVRMPLHAGRWQLRPIEGGRATFVRFTVRMDMGGWVPRSMVRDGSAKELPAMFQSVRRLLNRSPQRRMAWLPN